MSIHEKRSREIDKYAAIYGAGVSYTMNKRRLDQSLSALHGFLVSWPDSTSLLDVGCGDGQWMRHVVDLFGLECTGVDPVPGLAHEHVTTAAATDLPFNDSSFDVVTCLDVMEHLVPEDTEPALLEIARVARHGAIITVNNNPSHYRGIGNTELHINIKPYSEWQAMLVSVFGSAEMLNNSGANRVFIV